MCSGVWPPSNHPGSPGPVRASWPFVPRPAVLPWPCEVPRPTRRPALRTPRGRPTWCPGIGGPRPSLPSPRGGGRPGEPPPEERPGLRPHRPCRSAGADAGALRRRTQHDPRRPEVGDDLMRDGAIDERHEHHVLLRVLASFVDGTRDLVGLTEARTNVAAAVAHDDDRGEGEAPT